MNQTPNLKLKQVQANRKTWTDLMNDNLLIIDAAVGAYFTLQNLQGIWENSHEYESGQTVVDGETAAVWTCQVNHISSSIPTTFAEERAVNSTYWSVYSSPARARGAWEPLTSYGVNDFIVNGLQYAVCIAAHTSSSIFADDVAAGYWSILIDLSNIGSQVLPVLNGLVDANKFTVTDDVGTGYTIVNAAAALVLLGATTIGQNLFSAVSDSAARSAINAQVAGSYQTASTFLDVIAGLVPTQNTFPYINSSLQGALASLTTFGRTFIAQTSVGNARNQLGLGTAALSDTGITNNTIPILGTGGKLAASIIPSIDLTSMVAGVLPRSEGGFTPAEVEGALGANVNMTATGSYFDGPSITLGTGKWLVFGNVTVGNTVGGDVVSMKLWDGSNVKASSRMHLVSVGGTYYGVASFTGIFTNPSGNVRISVSPTSRTDGAIMFNASGNSMDCTIKAIRIG